MWRATFVSDLDPVIWRDMVNQVGGTIFHLHEWLSTKAAPGSRFVSIRCTDETGTLCAVAAGQVMASHWPVLSALDRSLILEAPPAVGDGGADAAHAAIGAILATARAAGFLMLHIRPFTSRLSAGQLNSLGFDTQPRWELILDLRVEEERLWRALRSGHQYSVKRGRKAGFALRVESTEAAFLTLLRLQRASQSRAGEKGNPYELGDEAAYRRLNAVLSPAQLSRIFMVMDAETPVAAALITVFNGYAYYTLAGVDEAGYEQGAPAFLIWEVLRMLRAEQIACLNLGGIPGTAPEEDSPQHGVYRFKTGFGGKMVESCGGVCTLLPGRAAFVRLIRRVTG